MGEHLRRLMAHRDELTKQQMKTLKGQILSGHGEAAMRGLDKILRRK